MSNSSGNGTRQPRSLMISPIMPALGGNGLAMRMGLFADALAEFSETHVLVIPVAGTLPESAPISQNFRLHRLTAGGGQLETTFALLSQIPDRERRLDAFIRWGRPSQSAGLSRPLLGAVAELVRSLSPDIVHIGRVAMTPCVGALPNWPKVTVDLDEDDCAAFSMRTSVNQSDAGWLRQEGLACDRLITDYCGRADRLYVSSAAEKAKLGRRHPALSFKVIPNAVTRPPVQKGIQTSTDRSTAIFVGSLSYPPNVDGLLWFIEKVMPLLDLPDFRLDILGDAAPRELVAASRRRNVTLRGWVKDIGEVYRRAALAILPLHSGGGTRIKLLEAAAHGTPFVATHLAGAGLSMPPQSCWFADDPKDFADSIRMLLTRPAEARRRAMNARRFVARQHDRRMVVAALAQELHSVL